MFYILILFFFSRCHSRKSISKKEDQLHSGKHKGLIFIKVEIWLHRSFPAMFKNECDLQGNGKWK